jgi:hypothetical protein
MGDKIKAAIARVSSKPIKRIKTRIVADEGFRNLPRGN